MASFKSNLLLLLLLSLLAVVVTGELATTHFHFYMHDTLSGPNNSVVKVVQGPTPLFPPVINFGDISVMDDPLTEGPNLTSKLIGRAQGFYSATTQGTKDAAFLLVANIVFEGGQYNGSTVAVLGRDAMLSPVRELPVVGGSAAFRLARGYATMKTYSVSKNTGDAVLEWDLYVMHG